MKLQVPQHIREHIVSQAQREKPNECCGYLGGSEDGQVSEAYPMRNIDESPTHFRLEPEEQFAVLKQAREAELQLIAVYHSHPETPPRPSDEDLRLAYDPETVYVIYSLLTDTMKAYTIRDHQVVGEIEVEIV